MFPAVVDGNRTVVCPFCGHLLVSPRREIKEEKQAILHHIKSFVLNYDSPSECKSYLELLEYANKKGYKPGWAYYQAKKRGMIIDRRTQDNE